MEGTLRAGVRPLATSPSGFPQLHRCFFEHGREPESFIAVSARRVRSILLFKVFPGLAVHSEVASSSGSPAAGHPYWFYREAPEGRRLAREMKMITNSAKSNHANQSPVWS